MRYVAFLDILGFKSKLEDFEHTEAIHFVKGFASTVYKNFKLLETSNNIKGYLISDSLILYSTDIEKSSLIALLNLIEKICKSLFRDHEIFIRGAITRGDFDKVPASPIDKLEKGLIVGQAYVEALSLEGVAHVIGTIASKDVVDDILKYKVKLDRLFKINTNMMVSTTSNRQNESEDCYLLNYFDIDFLLENDNLSKFINNTTKYKKVSHYKNTLTLVVENERDKDKINDFRRKLNDSEVLSIFNGYL